MNKVDGNRSSINWTPTLVIIILILLVVIINIAFASWPLLNLYFLRGIFPSTYPLIDKASLFTDQKDYIINLDPLRQDLNDLVNKNSTTTMSIYFEFLNSGANISINQDLRIWPASLSKLPIAMSAMKKVESGAWKLDTKLRLIDSDRNDLSGSLYKNPVGTYFSVEQLIMQLMVHSDNTAYTLLSRYMTDAEKQMIVGETGLSNLYDANGKITGKEYSRLFRTLYTSSFLERNDSSAILNWLAQSDFSQYLSTGLDKSVVFANKYGKNLTFQVFANSGIVYVPNRPYLITVMIQGDLKKNADDEEKKAQALMAEISAKAYQYVVHYQK